MEEVNEKNKYRRVRSYTRIWNVEMVLHAIGDIKLPFAVTGSQILWFVGSLVVIMFLSDVPPFSMIQSVLFKYFAIPVAIAWFVSKKTFEGKKPYKYLYSVVAYQFRKKETIRQKKITLHRPFTLNEQIQIVKTMREDENVISD
ncbi:conjugal transfer protein [Listeria ilorinensis]|uniref:conjugal transfer protein n=1 Tax=Listeria ilorinensis TaxID=2867439 RepID=UPI001EF6C5BC|nr:conjugal transfer protein [Listeria ilorinensis]